jgi:hypothetical protein
MSYARGEQLANVLPLMAAILPAAEARRGADASHAAVLAVNRCSAAPWDS